MQNAKPALASLAVSLLLATAAVQAQALKTIVNPQGGKIVYGPVEGQSTEAGAMGAVLRSLHNQFGDRPQVGKLFEVRGTQSVAVFFTVNKKKQGNGELAGLIIVTKATTDRVEAAVVSDDAAHLSATFNPMMKTLFTSWHPFDAAREAGSGSSAPNASLHKYVLPDRSASVDLPDGWKVEPSSAMGTILAEGPHGEIANLGFTLLVTDLNNPRARQTYQMVQRGGLRNTAYANALYYSLGPDLAKTFVDVIQMYRAKTHQPPATFQIANESPAPAPPATRCAHITGHVDPQDGKGMREMNTVFCTTAPRPASGGFLAVAYHTAIPNEIAASERATVGAVLASFSVDMAVVQRQANAYAAPAIEAIHAVGRAAAAQAAVAHERNEIQNSSVYQHWDDIDRRSKEFSNYQLGFSVVQDNVANAHGTLWNQDADELVKRDPQRYEYVNAPNFWKGVDY
jgi:hypothetical protein